MVFVAVGGRRDIQASTRRRHLVKLWSPLYPSNTAIKIVESDGQTGIITMQPGNLAFESAEAYDYLIQFLALRRLLGADGAQHVEN